MMALLKKPPDHHTNVCTAIIVLLLSAVTVCDTKNACNRYTLFMCVLLRTAFYYMTSDFLVCSTTYICT